MPEVPQYPPYPSEDEIYINRCLQRALFSARARIVGERLLTGMQLVGTYYSLSCGHMPPREVEGTADSLS